MGRLADFAGYLKGRGMVLAQTEQSLCALQEKYESFFAEVSQVREHELEQLTEHTLADRSVLPEWFNAELDGTRAAVERELDQRLAELEAERERIRDQAEAARQSSRVKEQDVRTMNLALDDEEEKLKARNQTLLRRVEDYNKRIRALGRGFGFFASFFKMRELAAQKKELDAEQTDVAARIEMLRTKWQEVASEQTDEERRLRSEWVATEAEAAALSVKIEALRQARPRMVLRTTLERVLDELSRETPAAATGDPACPRCGMANPESNHFCQVCARRLGDDRADFDGSLQEIAELNAHYERFSEGMKAGQEIIGLVRGLKSGVEAFSESVKDVQQSEDKYPLPKLEIDVPQQSLDYGNHFDRLHAAVNRDLSLHPKLFAGQVESFIFETFTEDAVQAYFEGMGEELSRQAEAQWE